MVLRPHYKDQENPIINYWRLIWIGVALTTAVFVINLTATAAPPTGFDAVKKGWEPLCETPSS